MPIGIIASTLTFLIQLNEFQHRYLQSKPARVPHAQYLYLTRYRASNRDERIKSVKCIWYKYYICICMYLRDTRTVSAQHIREHVTAYYNHSLPVEAVTWRQISLGRV